MTAGLAVPKRALAVGAHPDDIEFGCGGTLAKWAASGCEVHLLICTDGSKGSWDPSTDPAELVATRRSEQRAAARALGAREDVTFLSWPDGELVAGIEQRWEVCAWIRRLRPDVLLGHDPWRRYRLHPDHRNAGFLVTDGLVAARDPHFFPEQDAPAHRPAELLLFEAEEPDHLEDIGAHVETKLAALFAHRSQFRSTMGISDPEASSHDTTEEVRAFRQRVLADCAAAGAAGGVGAAEAFRRLPTDR